MKKKVEDIIKLIPVFTLLCYITGFIVHNTHLSSYGIVELNFFSLKYISAGILYLFLMILIIWPSHFILNQKDIQGKIWKKLLFSLSFSLIMFSFYGAFFFDNSAEFSYPAHFGILIFISLLAFMFIYSIKEKTLEVGSVPIYIFILGVGSMFAFGQAFKNIKSSVGGGKPYKNILIVEDELKGIIPVNCSNKTDTLTILYEDGQKVYFYNGTSIQSIKEKYIKSKIVIKE